MPVIINDFEIVTEASSEARGAAAQPTASVSSPGQLRPVDIERILAHVQARRLRVYAD